MDTIAKMQFADIVVALLVHTEDTFLVGCISGTGKNKVISDNKIHKSRKLAVTHFKELCIKKLNLLG